MPGEIIELPLLPPEVLTVNVVVANFALVSPSAFRVRPPVEIEGIVPDQEKAPFASAWIVAQALLASSQESLICSFGLNPPPLSETLLMTAPLVGEIETPAGPDTMKFALVKAPLEESTPIGYDPAVDVGTTKLHE